jgi:hypothetical protein
LIVIWRHKTTLPKKERASAMTKPKKDVNIPEFTEKQVKPVSMGARSETTAGPAAPLQIEPAPARADAIPDRAVIVQELEAIVQLRLFGRGRWLADREACCALERTMMQLGFIERVPGAPDSWRHTNLAKELNLGPYLVFAGLLYEEDVPMILEHYRLIDESMVDRLYERLEVGADPETLLRGWVQHAYLMFHSATKHLN